MASSFQEFFSTQVRRALSLFKGDRFIGTSLQDHAHWPHDDNEFALSGVNGSFFGRSNPNFGAGDALRDWRENPLARRIVSLTTQYVIGNGIRFEADDAATDAFLHVFWHHPLNQLDRRVIDWSDELTRSGNLFLRLSSDDSGMTYVRAIPSAMIRRINGHPTDYEEASSFDVVSGIGQSGRFTNLSPLADERIPAGDILAPTLAPVLIHIAINRPIGEQWGSSDLQPVLKWIRRYANWLEDRARLNRYRNSFLFVVKSRLSSEAQRLQRQRILNGQPPTPGSILVTTENEEWTVLSPKLESYEAQADGLALKKMIAVGAGVPLHFLAEPESENKSSAESAGSSSYRHFEARQRLFLDRMRELLMHAASRGALVDPRIRPDAGIRMIGADISATDNLKLSQAGVNAATAMGMLKEAGVADEEEFRRVVYRFLGESEG